ncbi:MAG: hypothetical protein WAQ28_17735 [Bacteroidia bacterium]|jgi:uncharacterized membrane protein YczE
MIKRLLFSGLCIFLLNGCTFTFGGTVFVITITDLLLYIFVAFLLALIASVLKPHNKLTRFWVTFAIGLVLTPLVSFIYLLVTVSRKVK